MSRYVITGASGHIGNNLVRYINKIESDADIISLNRRQVTKELDAAECTQVIGNMYERKFLEENIHEGDIVIHLAAFIDLNNRNKRIAKKVNYQMTKDICDICLKNKVKKFVYVSSVDAIAKKNVVGKLAEPESYDYKKVHGNYAKTKAKASQYVLNAIKTNESFNASIVIPSAVIGINDYKPSAIGNVIWHVVKGRHEFGIPGGYNFVDVEDVCEAIHAVANKWDREQYILGGNNVTVREMYEAINNCLHLNKKPTIFPRFMAYIVAPFVDVINFETIKTLKQNHDYNSDKAIKNLNYHITSFEKTIDKTVAWFKDYYGK